ncbi:hypothetical protein [Sphingobacterium sp. UDSM-2020]|uniref:hypothetical protein n=1 Tax=Sphingobacterium sp. UDSM-2020 TaxID=2795738 RepID=UPI001934EE72|nr:hypothetical protein [Sphingobacterium sp. UDSM-2020]QQD12268.1 hypothetical protein JAZ75_16855 [Sphingobacterium sp. UDSM-2020]
MSLEKYAKTVFNLPLDLKKDSVISEFRNFGEEENKGQAIIVVSVKGEKVKKFISRIPWSKPKLQSLDPESIKQYKEFKNITVFFDIQNQYVQIWYSEMESRFIKFANYAIGNKTNDVYYYKEFFSDEYGQLQRKLLLFDKKNQILFLLFNNM